MKGQSFQTGTSGAPAAALNSALARFSGVRVDPLFSQSPAALERQRAEGEARSHRQLPDLSHWYRLRLGPGGSAAELVSALTGLAIVEEAYAAPLPARPSATPQFFNFQGHLGAAPTGIDVPAAANYPGGKGEDVGIADVEYAWNLSHEDLVNPPITLVPNGTPVDPFDDDNHGTAVLGELVGNLNSFGVTGIVPASPEVIVVNANNTAGYNPAGAINVANFSLLKGDVIVVEQQAAGPGGTDLVPLEWIPSVYDAVKSAVARGLIVVEAAGNGVDNRTGVSLDASAYGTPFPQGKSDSGAIVVGAGSAPCRTDRPQRSRLTYGNYGSRVDLQGWGECVITTGYGTLYNPSKNAQYTNTFSGTSSATPIVAGAAALFSSVYSKTHSGATPDPRSVRNVLKFTGTPQNTSTIAGQIGPLPNLDSALLAADGQRPTITKVVPANGATGVPANTQVYPVFSEAMNKSATQAAFTVKRTSTGATVPGSFTWFGNALIFKPSSNLVSGAQYTATVSTAARDRAGNHFAAARVWRFTIG